MPRLRAALIAATALLALTPEPAPSPPSPMPGIARAAEHVSRTWERVDLHTVTVIDTTTVTVTVAPSTVRDVLTDLGVTLGPHDIVTPTLDTVTSNSLDVTIARASTELLTAQVITPFDELTVEDPTAWEGTRRITQNGRDGLARTLTRTTTVAGTVVDTVDVAHLVVVPALEQITTIGTRPRPALPPPGPAVEPGTARQMGADAVAARGWGTDQFQCLDALWTKESGWNHTAMNRSSGAYGIPQALPGDKMASAGADWATNPATQIAWGLSYIEGRYATPCGAWDASVAKGWY